MPIVLNLSIHRGLPHRLAMAKRKALNGMGTDPMVLDRDLHQGLVMVLMKALNGLKSNNIQFITRGLD
jgi:hypothetical protein